MVQSPAPIARAPVARSIAPPGIQNFVVGHRRPDHINPVVSILGYSELRGFDRRVAHNFQQLLVGPDIMFAWRDIQIAHKNASCATTWPLVTMHLGHLVKVGELLLKLRVFVWIGLITARRHIVVMNLYRALPGARFQFCRQMPRVP